MVINEQLYLSSPWLVDPSVQVNQVCAESFPQPIEKCQIKRDPKQSIKYTEDLSSYCTGGQVPITYRKKKKSFNEAQFIWKKYVIKRILLILLSYLILN